MEKPDDVKNTTQQFVLVQQPVAGDEISLIDLWQTLVRRKWLIWGVFFAAVALGVAAALLQPKKYDYRTSIEIGDYSLEGGKFQKIEQPATVLAKVGENYIFQVVAEYLAKHPEYAHPLRITARMPKKSELIVIEANGPETMQSVYLGLLDQVVEALRKDHQRVVRVVRASLLLELERAVQGLVLFETRKQALEAKYKRLDQLDQLLAGQIAELRRRIEAARQRYPEAELGVGNESAAMTMLLVANEIQSDQTRLQELEERLQIGQKDTRDELDVEIEELAGKISTQRLKLQEVQEKLDNLRETRAIAPPMRSAEPVGPSKRLIVMVAAVLGLILALMAAFFAEFMRKVRLAGERGE